MHSLGVAFVKKGGDDRGSGCDVAAARHSSSTYESPRMDIEHVRLEGPFNATGPGDTPSRQRIFVCRPEPSAASSTRNAPGKIRSVSDGKRVGVGSPREVIEDGEPACAKTILTSLARRAYRRPVTDADLAAAPPASIGTAAAKGTSKGDSSCARTAAGFSAVPVPRSSAIPASSTRWALSDQRRRTGLSACRSSSGAASPTTSCWMWRRKAG